MPPRGRPRKDRDKDKEKEPSEASPATESAKTESPAPTSAKQKRRGNNRCPQCKVDSADADERDEGREDWIRCDACKVWFHWRCIGPLNAPNPDSGAIEPVDLNDVDKWFCTPCLSADPSHRAITFKPPARKSTRKRPARDYARLHAGQIAIAHPSGSSTNGKGKSTEGLAAGLIGVGGAERWGALLREKDEAGAFSPAPFRHMLGSELGKEWLDTDPAALLEPVLIEEPKGLGMAMPPPELTVADVARLVGEDTPVEVMDVSTQKSAPGWTLGAWAAYFTAQPDSPERQRVLNVISLEISDTPLGAQVVAPQFVRALDWVHQFWPADRRGPGHTYPKVLLYCLMGVANAWTDWHVDFAGSSVYYHIHTGAKVFYFIRPTPANLAAFERWSSSEMQTTTWLGDFVDEVYKVELEQGNTMIIPTGWIHAVYTPVDTLVFGGNFLHSYNIATQFRIREIEISTGVSKKHQYPLFTKLCWYAADAYVRAFKAREEFSPRVLNSLVALARYLVAEARLLEGRELPHNANGHGHGKAAITQARRREAKEAVPTDCVKDAPALARELRWRVRVALGGASDGEDDVADELTRGKRRRTVPTGASVVANAINSSSAHAHGGSTSARGGASVAAAMQGPQLRHFIPKHWDATEVRGQEQTHTRRHVPVSSRPPPFSDASTGSDWTHAWMDEWEDVRALGSQDKPNGDAGAAMDVDEHKSEEPHVADEADADVEMKYEVLVRVRRTPRGLERQRIERRVEVWDWLEAAKGNSASAKPEDRAEHGAVVKTEGEDGGQDEDVEVVVD